MKPKLIFKMLPFGPMAFCANLESGNTIIWRYIRVAAVLAFVLAFAPTVHSQDVHVDCANVNPCTLTPSGGLPWSGANQTWIFTPIAPNANIYIHLHNQNTTSAHTSQTVAMFQSPFGKPTAPTLTQNSDFWVQDVLTQNPVAGASCNNVAINVTNSPGASGTGTCYAAGMQAGQIAIRITGANTQAGSPDNVDISITQSQAVYPGGPQPGNDSSAGGGPGTFLQLGPTAARTGNIANTNFHFIRCVNNAGIISDCVPPLLMTGDNNQSAGNVSTIFTAQGFSGNWSNATHLAVSVPLLAMDSLTSTTTLTASPSAWASISQANHGSSSTLDSAPQGVALTSIMAGWSATAQGTATQCSASVAASATAKKHVITGCSVCVSAGATPQTPIFANLRDGATGAGTVKAAGTLASITNGQSCWYFNGYSSGLIMGSSNTAATCELSAASAATVACAATIQGYDQ